MRNKFSDNLLKKGLISFAAASLLATSSFAVSGTYEGSVQDFTITMDKTSATKTVDTVNVVVQALDENGKLDILTSDTVTVTVNSVLGQIRDNDNSNGSTSGDKGKFGDKTGTLAENDIDFTNGKAGFSIYYPEDAKIGTDTIRFTVQVEDNDDNTPSKVFPYVDKSVIVTNPSNQAVGLEILAIEPLNDDCVAGSCKKSDYAENIDLDGNTTLGKPGHIIAGEEFSVKIQAITEEDNTSNIGDAQYGESSTVFQNSTVTLTFKEDADSNYTFTTVTGEMVEGVAFIDVPADTMTKDGLFYMVATTPTTQATDDSDYIAESNASYQIWIHPALPSAFKATLNSGSVDMKDSGDKNATITLQLTDAYGNDINDTKNLEDSYTATIQIDDQINRLTDLNTSGTVTTTSSSSTLVDIKISTDAKTRDGNVELDVSAKAGSSLSTDSDGIATAVVNIFSSILDVLTPIVEIPVYTKALNVTNWINTASDDLSELALFENGNATLKAGTLYEDIITIGGEDKVLTESVKVLVEILDDENESVVATSSAYSSSDGNVSLRFTKALKASEIGAARIKVDGYPYSDLNDTFIKEINTSVANSVGLYKLTNKDASTRVDMFTAVDSISLDFNENGDNTENNISIDTNTSEKNLNTNFDPDNPKYFLLLSDIYANPIDSGASGSGSIVLASDSGNLTPKLNGDTSSETLKIEDNDSVEVVYAKTGVDTLIFTSTIPGIEPFNLPVTIIDTTPVLDSVQIIAGSEYMLINGEMPITVKALNDAGNGFKIGNDEFSVVFSNPNLITLRDGNRSSSTQVIYDNGDFLSCKKSCPDADDTSIALSLVASNTVGTVDVTIRNTTGTVSATKTIHIVNSTADIKGVVEGVTASPESTQISNGESVDVTFTVVDQNGEGIANKTLQVKSDNSGIASLDVTETTDENGQVTVTVTSKAAGAVNVTATSEGKSAIAVIDVVEAAAMTISSTDVAIEENDQEIITVTNPAKTLDSSDIDNTDDSVVSVSIVDGDIILTALSVGEATVNVYDGVTSKDITVTVSEELVLGPVTDISSLGQSAYQTELGIANNNDYVTKNDDGSLTVNNKMKVAITDTEITITPVGDYVGYTVHHIELIDGVAPKSRAVAEYIQISDDKYLKVTLEKTPVPTTATTPALVAGWNLLGNASASNIDSTTLGAETVWTFDGSWTENGTIPNGAGFWYKSAAAGEALEFAIGQETAKASDNFTAGTWSLLGCGGTKTIADVKAKFDDVTVVWTYDGSVETWSSDDETIVKAGQGYWVK